MDYVRSNWLLLAVLSSFFAALTTIFAKIGVRDVPSSLATAIRTVVILLLAMVLVLAALFLDEPLTWKTALGGGLVVLGAIMVAWK